MKHNKRSSKKNGQHHQEMALVARISTGHWRHITCQVQPGTALSVLSECHPEQVDVHVLPGALNVRAIDGTGRPVVLTLAGQDMVNAYACSIYRDGRCKRDRIISTIGAVHAARGEAGQAYKFWNLRRCQVYMTQERADQLFMAEA